MKKKDKKERCKIRYWPGWTDHMLRKCGCSRCREILRLRQRSKLSIG